MSIDRETVTKIAHLSRLSLTEEDVARYGQQLSAILDYVDQLRKLNVDNVEPFNHAGSLVNVSREDAVKPSLTTDAALANAPSKNGPYFVVPRILEQ